jgi:hypothetical protein
MLDAEEIARFGSTNPGRLSQHETPPMKMKVRVTLRDGTTGTFEIGGMDEADILKRAAYEYPGALRLEALGYAPGAAYTNIVKRPTAHEPTNPLRVGLTAEMLPDIYDWRFYRGEGRGVPPEGVRMQVRYRPEDRFIGVESFLRKRGQGGLDPGLSYLGPEAEQRPWLRRIAYENFNIHDDNLHPAMTFVDEPYRRRGINTAAMDIAEEVTGRPVHPSTLQSDNAKDFWRERVTRPGMAGLPPLHTAEELRRLPGGGYRTPDHRLYAIPAEGGSRWEVREDFREPLGSYGSQDSAVEALIEAWNKILR